SLSQTSALRGNRFADSVGAMKALGAIGLLLLAACGSDEQKVDAAVHGDAHAVDAPHDARVIDGPLHDAPPDAPAHVLAVSCTCIPPDASTTTTTMIPYAYVPDSATIPLNGVVQFVMPANHNVEPFGVSDPGLAVNFGETKCLKFTTAGTFGFLCSLHG